MDLRFALLGLVVSVGCSSGSFDVGAALDDAGADSSADAAQGETAVADSGAAADAPSPPGDVGGVTCSAESDPLVVWVDAASTVASPTGTADCAFAHIVDAVAFVKTLPQKPRTIRVRAGEYAETAGIVLEKGMTLLGSGPKTVISGGGSCYPTTADYQCVVRAPGGTIVDGVTIDAGPSSRYGVITNNNDGSAASIVRNSTVMNASGDGTAGILVMDSVVLGPNIVVSKNRIGVNIWGHQTVKVLAGTNKFDENTYAAIFHEGTGLLTFEGGSVSNNASGIRLGPSADAATLPPMHDIQNLVARDNVEMAIRVASSSGLRLRKSTITGGKFGVIALMGATNRVDLGRPEELGGNSFGGASNRAQQASICVQGAPSMPMLAVGNRFPDCITKQRLADGAACEIITSYADLWWRGATEPDVSGCAKGP